MESESDNQKLSLVYDFDGEKLIDISKENDDLLIDSYIFDYLEDLRLSVSFDRPNEYEAFKLSEPSQEEENTAEKLLQKEQKLSTSHDLVPARPSCKRKSLAWDSAFFTSAGVLDTDELTFINEGLKTAEMQQPPDTCINVRMRKFEPGYTVNDDGFSPASRKINIGVQNRMKKPAFERQNIQRSVKNKTEISKIKGSHLLSVKAPKVYSRMKNMWTGQSKSASVDAYHAKMEHRSATFVSGNDVKLSKKSALENSCSPSSGPLSSSSSSAFARFTKDSTVSSPSLDKMASASSAKVPSDLLQRKTESRKSKLSVSTSTSDTAVKNLGKGKGFGHPRFLTQSLSLSNNFSRISSASSSFDWPSSGPISRARQQSGDTEVHLDTPVTLRPQYSTNNHHRKSTLTLQNQEINSPAQLNTEGLTDSCHAPTESRKKLKPSCLRMPSPKIGFFDEEKSLMPIVRGNLQLQFEMQCTPPSKCESSNRRTPGKLLRARASPDSKCLKHGSRSTQILHSVGDTKPRHVKSDGKVKRSSPKVHSSMKSGSDVGLRLQSRTCGEVEGGICSKCRRVDQTSILSRNDEVRVKGRMKSRLSREAKGQKDYASMHGEATNPIKKEQTASKQHNVNNLHSAKEDKTKTLAYSEDQMNDLSRYFEFINLSKDMLTDNNDPTSQGVDSCAENHVVNNIISTSNAENLLDDQKQGVPNISPNPSPISLSKAEVSPSSRTPLADKSSIFNRSESLMQLAQEKLVEKSSTFPFPKGPDKENALAL